MARSICTMLTIRHRPCVLFSEQILISCSKVVAPHYKRGMEPLTVLGIFLLGASAGSLITMIRYRHELGCLRAQFDQIQKEENQKDKEAA